MQIKLKRRNVWQRLPYAPGVFRAHYRILRKHCGRWEAARAAFLMLLVLIKPLRRR